MLFVQVDFELIKIDTVLDYVFLDVPILWVWVAIISVDGHRLSTARVLFLNELKSL